MKESSVRMNYVYQFACLPFKAVVEGEGIKRERSTKPRLSVIYCALFLQLERAHGSRKRVGRAPSVSVFTRVAISLKFVG